VGRAQRLEVLHGRAGADGLDQKVLHILLRLGEADVGHELDGDHGVRRGPGFGPVAHEGQLEGSPVVVEDVVDALGVGLEQLAGLLREVAGFGRRCSGEAHLAHEDVDADGLGAALEALAEPPLSNQPDQHHLDEPVVGMHQTEPPGESGVILGPDPRDALPCPGERDGVAGNPMGAARTGDTHPASRFRAE
jgi:hypothetical protein